MCAFVEIPGFNEHSLRDFGRCIGVRGEFQVARDFFGYQTGAPQQISLLRQMKLLQDYHLHMNVIKVGVEAFTDDDDAEIDSAIAFMRDTFATQNFAVGRVEHYFITQEEANGRDHIADDDEAEDLTEEWTVDNWAIDVFFVRSYAGSAIGAAPLNGPENKDRTGPMTGVVVAVDGSPTVTGFTLAKGICRYVGVEPSEHSNNLMYAIVPNGGNLTHGQRSEMLKGNFVTWGCGLAELVLVGG